MSRRALRRLRGEQRGQEEPGLGQLGLDPGPERGPEGLPPPVAAGRGQRGSARSGVSNRFELVRGDSGGGEVGACGVVVPGGGQRLWEGAAGVAITWGDWLRAGSDCEGLS